MSSQALSIQLPDRPLTDGDIERIRQVIVTEIGERDEVLDTEGACALLKVSETSLWRLIREMSLPVIKLNSRNTFLRSDLLAFARAHRYVFDLESQSFVAAADGQVA